MYRKTDLHFLLLWLLGRREPIDEFAPTGVAEFLPNQTLQVNVVGPEAGDLVAKASILGEQFVSLCG